MQQLDADTATFVQEKTAEIRARFNRTAEDVIAIGKALIEVKERLPHSQFYAWLGTEFNMHERSAAHYMQIARRFGSNQTLGSDLTFSVLRELSSPSLPDEIFEQVISGKIPASPPAIREAKASFAPTPLYDPRTEPLPAGLEFMAPHITEDPEVTAQRAGEDHMGRIMRAFQDFDDEFIAEFIMASTLEQCDRYQSFAESIHRMMDYLEEQIEIRRHTVLSVVSKRV